VQRLRVLLVDDEEDLVVTLVERLQLRGIEAEGVFSGADALRHVREASFDVLILDVRMPGIDGLALMAEIKRDDPDLPVILFTGHSSVEDAEEGMRGGASAYFIKPIDIEELVAKIMNAAGREGHEQP
jgi:two-component system, OmpR family, response regulator